MSYSYTGPVFVDDSTSVPLSAANMNNIRAAVEALHTQKLNLAGGTMTGALFGVDMRAGVNLFRATGSNTVGSQSADDLHFRTSDVERARFMSTGSLRLFSPVERTDAGSFIDRDAWLTLNRHFFSALTGDDHSVVDIRLTAKGGGTVSDRSQGLKVIALDENNVATLTITAATNASPIVITAAGHPFANGDKVIIWNAAGNTAANGVWVVANATANTFSLTGSTGNGAYTSGGLVTNRPMYYGIASYVYPRQNRGGITGAGVNGDDVACLALINANGQNAKGTDCIYIGNSTVTRKAITGAVNNGSGLIRLTVTGHGMTTGEQANVHGVLGVTASWGTWTVTVIDANTLDLQGSTFSGTYTGPGELADLSQPEWITAFTSDAATEHGIRMNSTVNQYGLDFIDGAFGIGQIRLKNNSWIKARTADNSIDQNVIRFNTLNEFQVEVPSRWNGNLTIGNGLHFIFSTGSVGTMIGTGATQKIGKWGSTPVVRPTGWGTFTGTATRTAFDTTTVTLPQLAERVKALIDDLKTVGEIGA